MPDGSRRIFAKVGSSFWVANGSADRLEQGRGGGWTYRRADDDSTSRFDSRASCSRHARNGWTTRYAYNAAGRLSTITNAFGRTLNLAYNSAGR